ncbi:MAG: DNA polymerase-1 [Candidatus Azotimanducaceae bacterium]|jgi:DNA polymerase-1
MSDKNQATDGLGQLVLVDGSSYLFRAYYALPDLRNSAGEPTGAIRGVIAMIRKLAKDYSGATLAIIFDAPGKTFRDDLYAEYKANRASTPDDLREQIQPIHEIVKAMGLPLLVVPGVEADDVIGTLAFQATLAKRETVISTGDKDMAQLVTEHVTLVNTMTETTMDRDGVVAKFGVPPERIIDYLALMGDTSDNIPGVPKVGPKTAAKWLNEYGTLEDVITNADNVKGKVGESLRDSLEQLPLSQALTTIKCDVELELSLTDLVTTEPDKDALSAQFTRFEFKGWLEEINASQEDQQLEQLEVVTSRDYRCVTDIEELKTFLDEVRSHGLCAVDTETTSLDYMRAELVGFCLAYKAGEAIYVPVGHDYVGAPFQLDLQEVLALLSPILIDEDIIKVGQNLKYDRSVLANYSVELAGPCHDTMLQSYVLNSVGSRHNMNDLAKNYLQRSTIKYEDVAGKGAKQLGFNEVPVEQASEYAAEDADVTLQLHQTLWPQLSAVPELTSVYQSIEMPLIPVLSDIERHGALVDGRLLTQHSAELVDRLGELKEQAWQFAGQEFNLDSPKQLQDIFYNKLGLPVLKKTPKGAPSTAEPVLVDLARDYELPAVILEYRGLAKLKSTYTDKLPLQINQDTGRIHTSYHQAVAATGRLSSSDPNLQNIPIRNAEGRRIRQAFVAPAGKSLVAADYSQIELRIMAHLSRDENLLRAFTNGEDVHRATAAEVFGTTPEGVSDDERRSAKAINFGLIYGMSAFGLGRQLSISRKLAADYIERYFERYPGVRQYMDETRALAREQGYVETIFGRRLYLPEINAKHVPRRQGAERTAINAPMQGSAADIIKKAMLSVHAWLPASGLDAAMIMQVHDELVFEVADAQVEELKEGVIARMEGAAELEVTLVVEAGVGANWDEAH